MSALDKNLSSEYSHVIELFAPQKPNQWSDVSYWAVCFFSEWYFHWFSAFSFTFSKVTWAIIPERTKGKYFISCTESVKIYVTGEWNEVNSLGMSIIIRQQWAAIVGPFRIFTDKTGLSTEWVHFVAAGHDAVPRHSHPLDSSDWSPGSFGFAAVGSMAGQNSAAAFERCSRQHEANSDRFLPSILQRWGRWRAGAVDCYSGAPKEVRLCFPKPLFRLLFPNLWPHMLSLSRSLHENESVVVMWKEGETYSLCQNDSLLCVECWTRVILCAFLQVLPCEMRCLHGGYVGNCWRNFVQSTAKIQHCASKNGGFRVFASSTLGWGRALPILHNAGSKSRITCFGLGSSH